MSRIFSQNKWLFGNWDRGHKASAPNGREELRNTDANFILMQ